MSPSSTPAVMVELNELDQSVMAVDVAYRLEFAPLKGDAPGATRRYIVLYLHPDHEDILLVVEAGGGTAGIVETFAGEKIIGVGDQIQLRWKDNNGDFWQAGGMCIKIMQGDRRELPNPLKEQLGMEVVRPVTVRRR